MSLIDNLRGAAKPPAAPDLLRRVQEAESNLAALESQHGAAALDAVTGGGENRLAELNRQIEVARQNLTTLRAAHRAAIARDEATLREKQAVLRKAQFNAARKHLESRDTAAADFSRAMSDAAKAFKAIIERSAKAQAACPIGLEWPQSSMCEPDPLLALVRQDMFRLSAPPGDQKCEKALPGSECRDLNFVWQPAALPPLADQLKEASAYVVKTLASAIAAD